MLYKPTTVSPHMEVVDPNDKSGILFNCEILNSGGLSKTRLMISDKNYEYYFDYNSSGISATNYGTNVDYTIFDNTNEQFEIYLSDMRRLDSESGRAKYKPFSLNVGCCYTWQMRFYEDATKAGYVPSSWIGYGTVNECSTVKKATSTNKYESNTDGTFKLLKIRPHTNMYFQKCVESSYEYFKLWSRYDDEAVYFIKICGKDYKIEDYYFYDPTGNFEETKDLDTYDEPIWGYAVIGTSDTIDPNEEYNIYCNYIDSDVYYFDVNTSSHIQLFEVFDDDTKRALNDGDIVQLTYSTLNIEGLYVQNEGATVNCYNFILEECEDDNIGRYTIIDSTKDIYSPIIRYSYNRFIHDHSYRLTLSATDTLGITTNQSLYIHVSYPVSNYPVQLKIEKYPERNSLIIDFSQLISISGKESVKGAHEFLVIDKETGKTDANTQHAKNACHIDQDNSLTFDTIDGDNIGLSFEQRRMAHYLICNIDNDYTGKIFEVLDEDEANNDLIVSWDGIQFRIDYPNSSAYYHPVEYFSPYSSWFNEYFEDGKTKADRINSVHMAMQTADCTVPFLYYDDLPYNEADKYDEGGVMAHQIWAIVVDAYGWNTYFKNITDNNSKWQKATSKKVDYE